MFVTLLRDAHDLLKLLRYFLFSFPDVRTHYLGSWLWYSICFGNGISQHGQLGDEWIEDDLLFGSYEKNIGELMDWLIIAIYQIQLRRYFVMYIVDSFLCVADRCLEVEYFPKCWEMIFLNLGPNMMNISFYFEFFPLHNCYNAFYYPT